MRKVVITPKAFEEFVEWANEDRRVLVKIVLLINDIQRSPFEGIGKPEPLKHDFQGVWSRRITGEHRLLYRIDDEDIIVSACRFHYDK